jgi:hypothetical protein
LLLTAIGLMPVAVLQENGRTYKKWTYITRKQNIHLTKKQHISQNFTVQYKYNDQNTKYNEQNTSYKTQKNKQHRKATKHENNEKATAEN